MVDGRNFAGMHPHLVEIEDRVCKKKLGPFPMTASSRLNVRVCVNPAGYGDVRVRNTTTKQPWIAVPNALPEAPILLPG